MVDNATIRDALQALPVAPAVHLDGKAERRARTLIRRVFFLLLRSLKAIVSLTNSSAVKRNGSPRGWSCIRLVNGVASTGMVQPEPGIILVSIYAPEIYYLRFKRAVMAMFAVNQLLLASMRSLWKE